MIEQYLTRSKKMGGALLHLPQTLRLVWTAARGWTLTWGSLLIVQGCLPAATVYFTKLLVDGFVRALGAGSDWEKLRPVLLLAAGLAALLLFAELLRSLSHFVRATQAELLADHLTSLLHQKSVAIDYAFYELPEYYDRLHRAREEAGYRPLALLESLGSLLQDGVTLVALLALLLPFYWWVPGVLLASTLPALFMVLRGTLQRYEWQRGVTAQERQTRYFDWLLTASEPAAEVRLFGLSTYFQTAYQRLRQTLRREHLRLAKQQSVTELVAGTLAWVTTGAVLAWVGWQALTGKATLGMVVLFYQAFNQGQQLLRSLLANVGQLYANSLFLGNLFDFLALQPQLTDPLHPTPAPEKLLSGISFDRVTFHYPGSERAALDDFSLHFPAGRFTAIVGENGAGKSTLLKLLCRFYDPEAGSITLDGTDLRALRLSELRRMMTVLFQQPVHYCATVTENIQLGALTTTPSQQEIEAAAAAAGATALIERLPQGYANLLGKWLAEGAELSVGEWQRIALARAFLRQAPIMLLDEPTSAMDSWAEADWIQRFRGLAAGRTVILITHRFTTARQADLIYVMQAGQVTETGTHEELVRQNGHYAASWRNQINSAAENAYAK